MMGAVLSCDGPTCERVSGRGEDVSGWWSLSRHGSAEACPPLMPLIPQLAMSLMIGAEPTTEDEQAEADLPDPEPDLPDDLKFCTTACLAAWASMAAGIE